MKKIKLFSLVILAFFDVQAQPADDRSLTKNDALFTTYAADMERTSYRWDQGYHFQFYKENEAISVRLR